MTQRVDCCTRKVSGFAFGACRRSFDEAVSGCLHVFGYRRTGGELPFVWQFRLKSRCIQQEGGRCRMHGCEHDCFCTVWKPLDFAHSVTAMVGRLPKDEMRTPVCPCCSPRQSRKPSLTDKKEYLPSVDSPPPPWAW